MTQSSPKRPRRPWGQKQPKAPWVTAFPSQVHATQTDTTKVSKSKTFKRIRRVSKAKAASHAQYVKEAREFVAKAKEFQVCPVFASFDVLPIKARKMLTFKSGRLKCSKLNEVHHVFGRAGRLLLWKPGWLAVSKWGHRVIHAFPDVARRIGWMAPEHIWNDFKRAEQFVTTGKL